MPSALQCSRASAFHLAVLRTSCLAECMWPSTTAGSYCQAAAQEAGAIRREDGLCCHPQTGKEACGAPCRCLAVQACQLATAVVEQPQQQQGLPSWDKHCCAQFKHGCWLLLQAHHGIGSPYTPSSLYTCDKDSASSDLDGLLFGDSNASAAFATTDTLGSCSQYLEPILRGIRVRSAPCLRAA